MARAGRKGEDRKGKSFHAQETRGNNTCMAHGKGICDQERAREAQEAPRGTQSLPADTQKTPNLRAQQAHNPGLRALGTHPATTQQAPKGIQQAPRRHPGFYAHNANMSAVA